MTFLSILKLPDPALQLIFDHLSPLDLLKLADTNTKHYNLIHKYPKQAASIYSPNLTISGWNGSDDEYKRLYIYGNVQKCWIDAVKNQPLKEIDVVFLEGRSHDEAEQKKARDLDLLLNNCHLNQTYDFLNLSNRKTYVMSLDINTTKIEEIVERIDKVRAAEINLLQISPDEMKSPFIDELFGNPTIQNLRGIKMMLSPESFDILPTLNAEVISIQLPSPIDDYQIIIKTLRKMVKEWLEFKRKLQKLVVSTRLGQEFIHVENGDLRFQDIYGQAIVLQITERLPGSFKSESTPGKLVGRGDGKGLLVTFLATNVVIIECDYESRRIRGKGDYLERSQLERAIQLLCYEVTYLQIDLMREERQERQKVEQVRRGKLWTDLIGSTDKENLSVFDGSTLQTPDPRPKEEIPPLKDEEHLVTIRLKFEEAITALEEREVGVDARELKIDELFNPNQVVVFDMVQEFKLNGWPDRVPPSELRGRIKYYKETGQFPSMFVPNRVPLGI